jgi:hypothetical protein
MKQQRRSLGSLAFGGMLLASLPSFVAAQVAESGVSLTGTNLRYYPRPTAAQCHADCAATPQCQGSTWIQAGTYNRSDPAMCYLMSAVTGRSPARGHESVVKSTDTARLPGPVTNPNDLDPSDFDNF